MENIFEGKPYLLGIDNSDGSDRSCRIYGNIIDGVVCIEKIEYTDLKVESQLDRLFPKVIVDGKLR